MYSLRRIGRIASAGLVALTASLFACSDAATPDRTVAPGRAPNRDITGSSAGLVAAYGFDETSGATTADASGTGNTGTLGDGVTRTTSGKFGGALAFTGGYVAVPNAASLTLSDAMTLEAWVNPSTVDDRWRDVIQKGNDNYYLMASSDNASRPAGGGKFGGATTTTKAFGTAMLAANVWTHLAATYDGATIRLYVNGAEVSRVAKTGAIVSSTNPLTIGGDAIYGQYFEGTIDEVRMYNRALSAAEVQADMNTAIGAKPAPPPTPADTKPPTVSITNPSSTGSYSTSASSVSISGAASDSVGVTQVTWTNSTGGSGPATGTAAWSATNIALQPGANVITVTARDSANNAATATLNVTRSDATPPPITGLVAAYGFDETSGPTTADASGKGNTGTLGSGVTRTTSGKFGGALVFKASSVTVPNAAPLNLTTAMTLEAWVNPSQIISAWRDIVQKGKDNYYLMASTDNGSRPAGGGMFAGEARTTKAYGTSALTMNTWTHLAVTYDGSAVRLYVNGTQTSSVPRSGAIMTSTSPLTLGGDPFFGQFFRGMIDEVRIYNRALSAAEVQADMQTSVGNATQPSQPPTPSDVTPPTVKITSPQASGTFTTTASSVTLSGTASDDVGVTQVRWSNSRGGSGTYSGTSSWSGTIALQSGTSVVTVTAQDAANNVATATLTVTSNPPLPPAIATQVTIATQPSSSALSGVSFAQQPVIQLRDASNNSVTQSGVVVAAAIATGGGTLGGTATATTNASGVASFTNLSITGTDGARTLRFSAGLLTAATSASVTVTTPSTAPPPSTSGACPNQPTGYTQISEQPWDQVPNYPTKSLGWVDDYWNASTALPVVDDATSPFPSANHKVAAGTFKQGMSGGGSPFFVYRPFAAQEQFRNLYICLYLKHSANFTNGGNAGTKFLWPSGDQMTGTQTYNGHDGTNLDFQFFQQGAVDRRLGANVNASAAQMINRRGQWVRYEMLLKANSSNSTANGELHVWIDGVKTHQYTNVQWQMSSARTWLSLGWNPTFGGGFNPVPATQYQYMDHIRVSGSNQ